MSKLSISDATKIANETFKDSIPEIEKLLNDVLKEHNISKEAKQAIFESVVASQKINIDITVSLLAQIVNNLSD